VEEVEKRGMPMEIALLPMIESAFNPQALSPMKASGLWQFIPSTGKIYGLEQNAWYDGRRDVLQATRAALDYLQNLHGMFGDWELALAAYNCGEGCVARAQGTRAGSSDYVSIKLPERNAQLRAQAGGGAQHHPGPGALRPQSGPDRPTRRIFMQVKSEAGPWKPARPPSWRKWTWRNFCPSIPPSSAG
jgi:hypothetical protein